jgi:hypothetical protein
MMEEIHSSEKSVVRRSTRRKIQEDGFLHKLNVFAGRIEPELSQGKPGPIPNYPLS